MLAGLSKEKSNEAGAKPGPEPRQAQVNSSGPREEASTSRVNVFKESSGHAQGLTSFTLTKPTINLTNLFIPISISLSGSRSILCILCNPHSDSGDVLRQVLTTGF